MMQNNLALLCCGSCAVPGQVAQRLRQAAGERKFSHPDRQAAAGGDLGAEAGGALGGVTRHPHLLVQRARHACQSLRHHAELHCRVPPHLQPPANRVQSRAQALVVLGTWWQNRVACQWTPQMPSAAPHFRRELQPAQALPARANACWIAGAATYASTSVHQRAVGPWMQRTSAAGGHRRWRRRRSAAWGPCPPAGSPRGSPAGRPTGTESLQHGRTGRC